jgi:hypothetical protein
MVLTPMRQDAVWLHATGSDGYQDTYSTNNIKCRFSQETKTVKKPDNVEVISSAVVRCAEAVQANDRITYDSHNYLVLSVREITGPGGGVIERELRL